MNPRSYLYQVQQGALVDGVGDGVDLLGDVKHVLVVGLVVLDATLLWTVRYHKTTLVFYCNTQIRHPRFCVFNMISTQKETI